VSLFRVLWIGSHLGSQALRSGHGMTVLLAMTLIDAKAMMQDNGDAVHTAE
jgi:hypothetical protein